MADIKEAIRRLIFEYISEGADKVIAQQEAVAASTTKTDKASLSLEKSFGSLERRYVETVRHQQDYQKVQEKVNDAVKQNPALQERANVVLAAAAEHYDKLALAANKGGIASSFLSKAISTILGPAGLMGVAMTAVGVAVGYMASKFQSSFPTIEQALEETNRLLKEGKILIDANASAYEKMFAQSKDLTQFQMLQNEHILRMQINEEMAKAVSLAQQRATTPTQVGGEMGEAPTGFGPLGAGYDKITAAFQTMQSAISQGLPGVQAYHTELAKIGAAHPELANLVNEMIKAGTASVTLEQNMAKLKAQLAVFAGTATDAERIAAGLEAADKAVKKQIRSLEDQLELIDAAQKGTFDKVKAEQAYRDAIESGANPALAKQLETTMLIVAEERQRVQNEIDLQNRRAQANQQAINAINQQNAYLQQQKEIYDEIVQVIGFSAARQVTFDPASGRIAVTRFGSSQYWTKDGQDTQFNPAGYQVGGAMDLSAQLGATQSGGFDYVAWQRDQAKKATELEKIYGPGGFTASEFSSALTPTTYTPTEAGLTFALTKTIEGILGRSGSISEAFNTALASGVTGNQLTQQLIGLAPEDQQASMIAAAIEAVSRQPATLAREQLLKQLTDKMEGLASSTDALNATMQSALSPYYSQDPRTTKLGFRAGVVGNPDWLTGATNATALDAILGAGATAPGMAGGGSFIVGGGYSATDNKIAQFPVASGEQVVVNRRPGGQATVVHNDNRIIVNGNLDQDTLSKLKVSRFQQAQRMRSASAA